MMVVFSESECSTWFQKWTYAMPLEVVYMNPLSNWNPYNIPHRGNGNSAAGRTIYDGPNGRRNGKASLDKAYNGTNSQKYFRTPTEFFLDAEDLDPADTVEKGIHVLDNDGVMRSVKSTGFWIHTPEIPGIGKLRQRYPIMPLHEEGTGVWKELAALTDIILEPSKYKHMFREDLSQQCAEACGPVPGSRATPAMNSQVLSADELDTSNIITTATPDTSNIITTATPHTSNIITTSIPSTSTTIQRTHPHSLPPSERRFVTQEASVEWERHEHYFTLSQHDMRALDGGQIISLTTDETLGHRHHMTLYKQGTKYLMGHCDCDTLCFDGHGRRVFLVMA